MTGWWRRNRLWLPAVPVAAAAMVAASSYQVRTFWYESGLHHEVASAPTGESVRTTQRYRDAVGSTTRTFTVQVGSLRVVDELPSTDIDPPPLPAGTTPTELSLAFEAAPDQALRGCRVTLVDDQGRRYEVPQDSGQINPCLPVGREGPETPVGRGDVRGTVGPGEDRPPTWTARPVFLLPDGVHVTSVLVWWNPPGYVELAVAD